MPRRPGGELLASDGLRARDNDAWGRQKLDFLDRYVPGAMRATQRMPTRVYVDLFAGPGKNVERGTGYEFDGSPMRMLRVHAPGDPRLGFTDAVFVNESKRDHLALDTRVQRMHADNQCRIAASRRRVLQGDANLVVPQIMSAIHPRSYVFVFADIEAPKQWPWTTVQAIKAGGHSAVDFYMLFPLDMAIPRLASYQRQQADRYATILTTFFGTRDWRDIAKRRVTSAHSQEFRRDIEALYVSQLHTLWRHVESVEVVKRRGAHFLYRMLFATNHPAGLNLSRWASSESPAFQGSLFG